MSEFWKFANSNNPIVVVFCVAILVTAYMIHDRWKAKNFIGFIKEKIEDNEEQTKERIDRHSGDIKENKEKVDRVLDNIEARLSENEKKTVEIGVEVKHIKKAIDRNGDRVIERIESLLKDKI